MEGKSSAERANIKASEIVRKNPEGVYQDPTYGLQIKVQSISKIEGGVEVFARAWREGQQLGFGTDGSVEIERFRIFNPPVLVPDPNGEIVREWAVKKRKNLTSNDFVKTQPQHYGKLGPHHIGCRKKGDSIVKGKIGTPPLSLTPLREQLPQSMVQFVMPKACVVLYAMLFLRSRQMWLKIFVVSPHVI